MIREFESQIEEQQKLIERYEKALKEIEDYQCFDSSCDSFRIANKALS